MEVVAPMAVVAMAMEVVATATVAEEVGEVELEAEEARPFLLPVVESQRRGFPELRGRFLALTWDALLCTDRTLEQKTLVVKNG